MRILYICKALKNVPERKNVINALWPDLAAAHNSIIQRGCRASVGRGGKGTVTSIKVNGQCGCKCPVLKLQRDQSYCRSQLTQMPSDSHPDTVWGRLSTSPSTNCLTAIGP